MNFWLSFFIINFWFSLDRFLKGIIPSISLSNFIFIYGKRRLVLSLLLGFFFGYLSKVYFSFDLLSSLPFLSSYNLGFLEQYGLASIGNIIPGLIASWMDRQGSIKTVSVIIIIAVLTRLIMIIISGGMLYV